MQTKIAYLEVPKKCLRSQDQIHLDRPNVIMSNILLLQVLVTHSWIHIMDFLQYEEASQVLTRDAPHVRLAKIDVDKYNIMATKYDIV